MITAAIGDIAAHFGCISHIKDSITAITIVALGTSVPGLTTNNSAVFVCVHFFWNMHVSEESSSRTLYIKYAYLKDVRSNMYCSCLDTFASKQAACGDATADASVGNVTGSNAVNVFLGIGIAWSMAAIYWEAQGLVFEVPVGR